MGGDKGFVVMVKDMLSFRPSGFKENSHNSFVVI
jgi:hypothetical protein